MIYPHHIEWFYQWYSMWLYFIVAMVCVFIIEEKHFPDGSEFIFECFGLGTIIWLPVWGLGHLVSWMFNGLPFPLFWFYLFFLPGLVIMVITVKTIFVMLPDLRKKRKIHHVKNKWLKRIESTDDDGELLTLAKELHEFYWNDNELASMALKKIKKRQVMIEFILNSTYPFGHFEGIVLMALTKTDSFEKAVLMNKNKTIAYHLLLNSEGYRYNDKGVMEEKLITMIPVKAQWTEYFSCIRYPKNIKAILEKYNDEALMLKAIKKDRDSDIKSTAISKISGKNYDTVLKCLNSHDKKEMFIAETFISSLEDPQHIENIAIGNYERLFKQYAVNCLPEQKRVELFQTTNDRDLKSMILNTSDDDHFLSSIVLENSDYSKAAAQMLSLDAAKKLFDKVEHDHLKVVLMRRIDDQDFLTQQIQGKDNSFLLKSQAVTRSTHMKLIKDIAFSDIWPWEWRVFAVMQLTGRDEFKQALKGVLDTDVIDSAFNGYGNAVNTISNKLIDVLDLSVPFCPLCGGDIVDKSDKRVSRTYKKVAYSDIPDMVEDVSWHDYKACSQCKVFTRG